MAGHPISLIAQPKILHLHRFATYTLSLYLAILFTGQCAAANDIDDTILNAWHNVGNPLNPIDPIDNKSQFRLQNITLYSTGNTVGSTAESLHTSSQNITQSQYQFDNSIKFDIFISNRNKLYATYNSNNGFLNVQKRNNSPTLDKYRIYAQKKKRINWIVGHYAIGFGSRLTFDNSNLSSPNGIQLKEPYKISYIMGEIESASTLRGIAYQYRKKLRSGTIDIALFSSQQLLAIVQSNLQYGPDEWVSSILGECNNTNSQVGPYECNTNKQWFTNQLRNETNAWNKIEHATLEDAISEQLIGQHFSLQIAKHRLGIVNYNAKLKLLLDAPMSQFSAQSRFPNAANLHASGVYYQYRGSYNIDTEISQFNDKGLAAHLQWQKKISTESIINIAMRYFNDAYSNPYTPTKPALHYAPGSGQPSEQGVKFSFSQKKSLIHSSTTIDLWRNPTQTQVKINPEDKNDNSLNLIMRQSILWRVDNSLRLKLDSEIINKNIQRNGRQESYLNADEYGNGERRSLKLTVNKKFGTYQHIFSYRYRWQDVARYSDKFDTEQSIRYQGKLAITANASFNFQTNYRIRHIPYNGKYYPQSNNYKFVATSIVNQQISTHWNAALRLDMMTPKNKKFQIVTTAFQITYRL